MPATLEVDTTIVERRLVIIKRVLTDRSVALKIYARVIADGTERRFATADNGRWRDILRRSRLRRKGDKNAPPLSDTYALRQSATAIRSGVRFSSYAIRGDEMTIGTWRPGAAANQKTRRFLTITEQDEIQARTDFERNVLRPALGSVR